MLKWLRLVKSPEQLLNKVHIWNGNQFLRHDTKSTGTAPGFKDIVAKLCNDNMTWCTVAQQYYDLTLWKKQLQTNTFFFSVLQPLQNDLLTVIILAIWFNNICKSWRVTSLINLSLFKLAKPEVSWLSQQTSLLHLLYGPHNTEDPGVFVCRRSSSFDF